MELEELKRLLNIKDSKQDKTLGFILEDVTETILNYCHIRKLPDGLINTAYRMAIDLYRYEQPGNSNAPVVVSSISEGDTSTSFIRAGDALSGGILKNYQGQLNQYRKLVW